MPGAMNGTLGSLPDGLNVMGMRLRANIIRRIAGITQQYSPSLLYRFLHKYTLQMNALAVHFAT